MMHKALFIDMDMLFLDNGSGHFEAELLAPLAVVNLYRIQKQLEYELVLFHPAASSHSGMVGRALKFLHAQGIVIRHQIATEELSTAFRLLADYYDWSRSWLLSCDSVHDGIAGQYGISCLNREEKTAFTWSGLYSKLVPVSRLVCVSRKTKETDVSVVLNLDGTGQSNISSGLEFLDHMLDQIARHGGIDLEVQVKGDLVVDEHHSIEDCGLALGNAVREALGKKTGVERYGFFLPMDDANARVALDFSGRPYCVWKLEFKREKIGAVPTEMFEHFFKSFCDAAGCNLYVESDGENEHHKIEAVYKAFGRSLRAAVKRDLENPDVPSTKGRL